MKLLRLKLENFRQHQSTDVSFSDGMTAIVGANGTGKTTLLEAVTFALFGEIRAGKVDDLRFFWSESKKYVARLTFEVGERTFEVERSTYDASLKQMGRDSADPARTLATGKDPTTAACEKLLGLTYDQFANSFCAEQKALRFLHFKDNRERQAEVARMLGYDRLEGAEELAIERRRDFAKKRQWIAAALPDPVQLETAKSEAQSRLTAAKQKAKDAQEAKKELEKKLPTVKETAAKAAQWLAFAQDMNAIAGKAEGLKANVKTTDEAVKALEKDAAEFAALGPVEAQYQEARKRLLELAKLQDQNARREQIQKEADSRAAEAETLGKQIAGLNLHDAAEIVRAVEAAVKLRLEAQKGLEAEQKAWSDSRATISSDLGKATSRKEAAAENLKTAEEMVAKGVCPECGQAIGSGYEAIIETRRKEAIKTAEAVAALEVKKGAIEAKPKPLLEAEAHLAAAEKAHAQARDLSEQAGKLATQATALDNQRKQALERRDLLLKQLVDTAAAFDPAEKVRLDSTVAALEPKHSRYLQVQAAPSQLAVAKQRFEAAQKEHDAERDRYRALDAQRKALPFANADEAKAAEDSLRCLDLEYNISQKDLAIAARDEAAAKKDLEATAKAIADYKEKKKEMAELEQAETLHGTTGGELKALRLFLNAELGPELEARASENITLLTNGRYSKISLDKNFAATLFDDDNVHKPVISGGEEDVVALALRLALSELIQERQGRPMSLLILDEVFGSLDVDRRQSVMDRLSSLKGRFEQILVISHIEEINQVADQCLYLTRDTQTKATTVSDAPPGGFGDLLQ